MVVLKQILPRNLYRFLEFLLAKMCMSRDIIEVMGHTLNLIIVLHKMEMLSITSPQRGILTPILGKEER